MFIEINETLYSSYYIQTIKKIDEVEGDKTIYKIRYFIVNGDSIDETFDSESARNSKYNKLAPNEG